MPIPRRWQDMRGPETPLGEVIESFMIQRSDLSEVTLRNYRLALRTFARWCEQELERPVVVGDVESNTVAAYLSFRKSAASAELARVGWVALRSLAKYPAEARIHSDEGESVLRHVRQPKVKEERRRNLTDNEHWRVIERASEGEQGPRDHAIVITLLGTGLRRAELIGLQLADLDLGERLLRVRASTSKSVHPREIAVPSEVVKVLDRYVNDYRRGDTSDDAPLFTDRRGGRLTGQAVRRLFDRLKARTGVRDLCAHMLRHTWATNYNRSKSGSTFDLQVEGGWTTARMVERYCKARPLAERRRAPSPFTAPRAARAEAERRPAEKRPPQQRSVLSGMRTRDGAITTDL
jgi:site-specific recombinase XerD